MHSKPFKYLTASIISFVILAMVLPSVIVAQVAKTAQKSPKAQEKEKEGIVEDAKGKSEKVLEVKKYTAEPIKTPMFSTSVERSVIPEKEWMEFKVVYSTFKDWMDDLVFQYYVLVSRKEEGKTVYTLFKKNVKYGDIEKGKGHISAVYLKPKAIKRYGEVVASAVEIMVNGEVIADDQKNTLNLKDKWWKDAKIMEDPKNPIGVLEGYLLNRAESPYALINMDDYEVIK